MGLIDFLLNLAGLLLWLNWRAVKLDPLSRATPATLAGTLRRAEPTRLKRWHFLAALAGLILFRALLYWQIGSAVDWTATVRLVAFSISFRSDIPGRMLLYSVFSFGLAVAVYFLWLLLLSLLNRRAADTDPIQKLVRLQLGRVDGWPRAVKLLLPFVAGTAAWWLLSWPLAHWELVPHPASQAHRIEQATLVGVAAYLSWKHLVGAVLLLHVLNSYVYFGSHPLWSFINASARNLLSPLHRMPLRTGRVDFAPLLGIALVYLLAHVAEHGLKLPFGLEIPGLADCYLRLPL